MEHSPGFLKLVDEAKKHVRQLSVDDVKEKLDRGDRFAFVDVREDDEWRAGRAKGSSHLGKGIIERDIEKTFPDKDTELVLYCGGGFRSALAAESLQRMGYRNVHSMEGGIREWRARGLPEDRDGC